MPNFPVNATLQINTKNCAIADWSPCAALECFFKSLFSESAAQRCRGRGNDACFSRLRLWPARALQRSALFQRQLCIVEDRWHRGGHQRCHAVSERHANRQRIGAAATGTDGYRQHALLYGERATLAK